MSKFINSNLYLRIVFILIAFILLAYNSTFSQSKLKIGFDFRDEIVHQIPGGSEFQFPSLDFLILYNFSKDYSAEFNAGFKFPMFDLFIVGPDYGMSIRRTIINNHLYVKCNFTLHYNRGNMGHAAGSGGDLSYEGIFPMIGLGIDINTSENIYFNLIFFKFLKEKIAYSYSDIDKYIITGEYRVPFYLRFGFSFYWDIL